MSALFFGLFVFAAIKSEQRHVGDLHPGTPELRADSRYNVDSQVIADKFSIGLDLMTIVIETPPQSCIDYNYMGYVNEFSWYMRNVPGVRDVLSAPFLAKQINAGWNEGNLKWRAVPRNPYSLVQAVGPSRLIGDRRRHDLACPGVLDRRQGDHDQAGRRRRQRLDRQARLPAGPEPRRNNKDKVMPPEYLVDGKFRREPASRPAPDHDAGRIGWPRLHGAHSG